MHFGEIYNEVVTTCKRPDLAVQIRREINAAISFCCLDNSFARDYAEPVIVLDANEYTQAFPLSDMPRFRKFRYLKRGGTKKYLTKISDAEMLKGCTDKDKYYIVGTNVNVSLAALAATLDVGYFMYPPTLTQVAGNREFWLLEVAPWMIINKACAGIFKSIGFEKDYKTHMDMFTLEYVTARKDFAFE